jgi:outer membrane protein TolC
LNSFLGEILPFIAQIIFCLSLLLGSHWVLAKENPPALVFKHFLGQYLKKNPSALQAQRELSGAERNRSQATDQWRSRFTARPALAFEEQVFGPGGRDDNSNRTSQVFGEFTQMFPYGTSLTLQGNKFLEAQNPLFQVVDRSYSATLSQDLANNVFGKSQQAESAQGEKDYEAAELEFRQALVDTCEQAFTLYTDAYIQQEITALLQVQLQDAQQALNISRKLFRDKLINKVDQLTSENDFIDTQLQAQQAQQQLVNLKRQIQAFLDQGYTPNFSLIDPSSFLKQSIAADQSLTLSEALIKKRLESQEFAVERARSDRWTDVALQVEAGENIGRQFFTNNPVDFQEQYLRANITFGFDLINNTEDDNLRNAVFQKNNIIKEQMTIEKTQKMRVQNLQEMNDLLASQVKSSEKQVSLLREKMKIAFGQMKRARLDFQNYLLHRNAYLNQQTNYLNLKKDLWLNQFSLKKEYAHSTPALCEVSS